MMLALDISSDARKSFYDVAALGLHALEALPHGRRRFDDESIAGWGTSRRRLKSWQRST
jgi:hypothetical protein